MNSTHAKSILDELNTLFADPTQLVGGLTMTYIAKQAGADRPIDRWSWSNRLLVWLRKSEDARTFNQWAEIGRSVKKGSKAFYLLAPCTKKWKSKDEDDDEIHIRIVGFRSFPVFKQEDTEGKPLPAPPDYSPNDLPPFYEVAKSWGLSVKYRANGAGAWGSFSQDADHIMLATYEDTVFFHELGHAADRQVQGKLKPGQDPQQEAVAELVAAVLARMTGKKMDKTAWEYIKGYATDPHKMFKKVLPRVEAALDEIFKAKTPVMA